MPFSPSKYKSWEEFYKYLAPLLIKEKTKADKLYRIKSAKEDFEKAQRSRQYIQNGTKKYLFGKIAANLDALHKQLEREEPKSYNNIKPKKVAIGATITPVNESNKPSLNQEQLAILFVMLRNVGITIKDINKKEYAKIFTLLTGYKEEPFRKILSHWSKQTALKKVS